MIAHGRRCMWVRHSRRFMKNKSRSLLCHDWYWHLLMCLSQATPPDSALEPDLNKRKSDLTQNFNYLKLFQNTVLETLKVKKINGNYHALTDGKTQNHRTRVVHYSPVRAEGLLPGLCPVSSPVPSIKEHKHLPPPLTLTPDVQFVSQPLLRARSRATFCCGASRTEAWADQTDRIGYTCRPAGLFFPKKES